MVFGKIEYLNLLPFHLFMKRYIQSASATMGMEYKRSVPAKINKAFHSRRVDAAFISSIKAQKSNSVKLGIIAKKNVRSVIILPNRDSKKDAESASSNVLANILDQKGEVLIGDKALRYTLEHDDYIDLATLWHQHHKHPFVFALLCYHKDKKLYKRIEKEFLKRPVKIPRYCLQKAALRTDIAEKEILEYLKLISYKLDKKAQLGLKKFYTLANS